MSFFAYGKQVPTPNLNQIFEEYFQLTKFQSIENKHLTRADRDRCRPPSGRGCFKTACSNLGAFECDDDNEIDQLLRACRGNYDGDCITKSITFMHKFEYDDLEEMVTLANSCRGVFDLECVDFMCERLGSFGCDDLEEIASVNKKCAGY